MDNWTRLKSTQELFDAFRSDPAYWGEPVYSVKGVSDLPSHLRNGLRNAYGDKVLGYGGTWAHPDIAIAFAQWCSPGFQLWVSRQIRHLLTYGEVNIHYTEWDTSTVLKGVDFNRDDIREMYGR